MKKTRTTPNPRTERLLAVHAIAASTLKAAIATPSPLRVAKLRKRAVMKARPPGYKPNRSFLEEWGDQQARLAFEHPSDHFPRPRPTPEAATGEVAAVTLSARELHILLAAAVPPGRTIRTRRAHVRIRDAIELFSDELAALTSKIPTDSLIAAAQLLATAADAWLAQAARARRAEADKAAAWKAKVRAIAIINGTRQSETVVLPLFQVTTRARG